MADTAPIENSTLQAERFESDTHKIVRRHLEDPNHIISEEELKNVRIGMSPTKGDSEIDADIDTTEINRKEDLQMIK